MAVLRSCSTCGVQKPHTEEYFKSSKSCKNGLAGTCLECRKAYQKSWADLNRETLNAKAREYKLRTREHRLELRRNRYDPVRNARDTMRRIRADPVGAAARRLRGGARDRCKSLGLVLDPRITVEYMYRWLQKQPQCECCGVAFDYSKGKGYFNDHSPSLDRFVPSDGYVMPNLSLICWRCNNIKRNYTKDDLQCVADWMEDKKIRNFRVPTKTYGITFCRLDDGLQRLVARLEGVP